MLDEDLFRPRAELGPCTFDTPSHISLESIQPSILTISEHNFGGDRSLIRWDQSSPLKYPHQNSQFKYPDQSSQFKYPDQSSPLKYTILGDQTIEDIPDEDMAKIPTRRGSISCGGRSRQGEMVGGNPMGSVYLDDRFKVMQGAVVTKGLSFVGGNLVSGSEKQMGGDRTSILGSPGMEKSERSRIFSDHEGRSGPFG